MRVLLFLFVAVLVNFPYAHERWTDHRVETRGVDVVAIVLNERDLNDKYLVDYQLPPEFDAKKTTYSAAVDRATFENAQATARIAVRVVKGHPDQNRPLGLVASSLFKVIAISADAVLALVLVGFWWRRRR